MKSQESFLLKFLGQIEHTSHALHLFKHSVELGTKDMRDDE